MITRRTFLRTGRSRASSGGETRVVRAAYGDQRIYVEMVARALELWRENEARWNKKSRGTSGAASKWPERLQRLRL